MSEREEVATEAVGVSAAPTRGDVAPSAPPADLGPDVEGASAAAAKSESSSSSPTADKDDKVKNSITRSL